MAIFFAAVEGDPLDSGGNSRVVEGARSITIEGGDGRSRRMALLGHQAWCDACKSAGVIVAAAGSPSRNRLIDFTSSGQRQALGGDQVICKCEQHPRIVPVHGRRWTVRPDVAPADMPPPTASRSFETPPAERVDNAYDEHFILIDRRTGQPVRGFAWGVATSDGQCEGCTDADGKTQVVEGREPAQITLMWVMQTEMGVRP